MNKIRHGYCFYGICSSLSIEIAKTIWKVKMVWVGVIFFLFDFGFFEAGSHIWQAGFKLTM